VPALLSFYPQSAPSRTVVLSEGDILVAGRDPDCEILLVDGRVSARHARFESRAGLFRVHDLGSKNGTFVNGLRVTDSRLSDEDWISFGGLPARFKLASEKDVEDVRKERVSRSQSSAELNLALEREPDARGLLSRLVESAVTVAGAERGFVLVQSAGGTMHAVAEVAAAHPHRSGFAGSRGAVERVLATGRPVVTSNAGAEAFLGKRPSVLELGLGAVACIPLHEGARLIGVLYLDGKRAGAAFTELDVELLETLADRAGILLASQRLDIELRELADASLVVAVE